MKTLIILFFLFCALTPCFSQPTPAQIERSQQLLDKEQALRSELEKGEKVFIKKIILKGVTLLQPEEIEAMLSPFQKHWLTKADIRQIQTVIEQEYAKNGYPNAIKGFSSLIKKQALEIQVEEIRY